MLGNICSELHWQVVNGGRCFFNSKRNLKIMTEYLPGANFNLVMLVDFSLPANVKWAGLWGTDNVIIKS